MHEIHDLVCYTTLNFGLIGGLTKFYFLDYVNFKGE